MGRVGASRPIAHLPDRGLVIDCGGDHGGVVCGVGHADDLVAVARNRNRRAACQPVKKVGQVRLALLRAVDILGACYGGGWGGGFKKGEPDPNEWMAMGGGLRSGQGWL